MISVNDEELPWHEDMTVADMLQQIHGGHDYVVVKVNDRYVSKPDFDSYQIPDRSEIYLIPMIAGG